MPSSLWQRRSFLAGGTGLGLALGFRLPLALAADAPTTTAVNAPPGQTLVPTPKLPMPARPSPIFDVYLAAHQHGAGSVVQFWYQGHVYVCPPGAQARPVLSVQGLSFTRATLLPDGRLKNALIEVGYYGDPGTGAISDSVVNPFTNRAIVPKHYKSGPQVWFAAADGALSAPDLLRIVPGATFNGHLTAPVTQGGSVFFSENLEVFMPADARRRTPVALTSLTNYSAPGYELSRAQAGGRDFVPCVMDFVGAGPVEPWLGMDQPGGTRLMRLYGKKLRPGEAVPAALVARIEKDHPGFLVNPGV